MTAATRSVREAVPPAAGRGPRMIVDVTGAARPLMDRQLHRQFCGFLSTLPHASNRQLVQCSGCRCWLVRRHPAVTR